MSARLDDRFRANDDPILHWSEVDYLRECGTPEWLIAQRLNVSLETLHRAEYRTGRRGPG